MVSIQQGRPLDENGQGIMTVSFFLQMLLNGLQLASVYILIALGFTLIFGILEIVNMAHGSFYMLGGYAVWILFARLKVNYFLSLILTIVDHWVHRSRH